VRIKETSENEPSDEVPKNVIKHQNRGLAELRDKFRGSLFTAWTVLGIKAA
jgi:hypothetical protein